VGIAIEHPRGGFTRTRAHDDENGQLVHDVGDAILRSALGGT
jgi:hypothetical protein